MRLLRRQQVSVTIPLRAPFGLGARFVSISLAVAGGWHIGAWALGPGGPAQPAGAIAAAIIGDVGTPFGDTEVLRGVGAFFYGRWGPVLGTALYGVWLALLLRRLHWRAILLVPAAALPLVPLVPLVFSSPTGSSPLPPSPAPLDLVEVAAGVCVLGLLWAYQGLLVGVLLAWIHSHSTLHSAALSATEPSGSASA